MMEGDEDGLKSDCNEVSNVMWKNFFWWGIGVDEHIASGWPQGALGTEDDARTKHVQIQLHLLLEDTLSWSRRRLI